MASLERTPTPEGPPPMHWHSEWDRLSHLFIEWVYFKFFAGDIEGMIIYGMGFGMPGALSVQVFRKGEATRVVRHDFRRDQVQRSLTNYDCRIDSSQIVTGENGYQIEGAITDLGATTSVSWALTFDRLMAPLRGFDQRFGLLRSQMGWDVIAPLAAVHGTVTVDGDPVTIEGKGYVDTNFGHWLFTVDPTTNWNWLMAFDDQADPPQAVVGLNLRRRPRIGALFHISEAGARRFCCDEGTFRHLRFVADAETGIQIPVLTEVTAADGSGHRLELTVTNESAFVYRQAIPPKEMRGPLPTILEWVVTESFVSVAGALRSSNGGGRDFQGKGIKEYPISRLVWQR